MWLRDDDVAVREALGRASFVENVQVVSTARPSETGFFHSPFFNAILEMAPDMDGDWDTFFKNR